MDLEQWLKLATWLAPAALGCASLWLSTRQFPWGARTAYREEYKFAKSFFEDLEQHPKMHAFAQQKGYQAIVGSQDLSASLIKHLMSLLDPGLALQDYVLSKSYLKHTPGRSNRQLSFASAAFSTRKRCQAIGVAYFVGFLVFYTSAFLPLFLWTWAKISSPLAISLTVFTLPVGLFCAFFFAREFRRLRGAMGLIKRQNDEADSNELADDERD
ncbi:hypothetical protein [Janthinobacterium fluminis]|uniref:Uncharacterized protein n=1 Tax=Janthinobacterium fluminis TaxID=2987524 RepID=A0ABT5K247_9BURK|nr:hypothetical protein [Janthinobacterium fluminis]MDC8759048.1 hypothetical protein [Janthinobacterium fluminis]